MGQISSKFIYMKTCPICLKPYWTTAKRTPFGLCNTCYEKSDKKKRRPPGNLTDKQVKMHISKMKKQCEERLKDANIKKSSKRK